MTRDERERFAQLFHQLICDDAAAKQDPGLRLLSHALLNFLKTPLEPSDGEQPAPDERAAGATARHRAEQVARALPWLALFLSSSSQAKDSSELEELGAQIARIIPPKLLSAGFIARKLAAFRPLDAREDNHRSARPPANFSKTSSRQEEQLRAIVELAQREYILSQLISLDDRALARRLIEDDAAMLAARELSDSGENNPLALRLRELFGRPASAGGLDQTARREQLALRALAALVGELGEQPDLFLSKRVELGERSRSFEQGLARSMDTAGLIFAVRAALAYPAGNDEKNTAPGTPDRRAQSEKRADRSALSSAAFLGQFDIFVEDPTLMALAQALIEARGLCLAHLRGGAPLASLAGWVDYLRAGCVELAEARQYSLSEAVSYAHYCLHLLNICDLSARVLAASGPEDHSWVLTESMREQLGRLEDDLKEFSLLGQRHGVLDARADLGRFERARWRREGEAGFLADRLSRLRGAWRKDARSGPVGAPVALDPEINAHSLAIIENMLPEGDDRLINALAEVIGNMGLREFEWLELLAPAQILKLLATLAAAARDLPGIDIRRPFEVDLAPLKRYALSAERGRLNRRVMGVFLERLSIAEILNSDREPRALRRGLVAHTRRSDGRMLALDNQGFFELPPSDERLDEGAQATLVIDFIADAELSALLDLICQSTSQDPAFHALLEARLQDMLGARLAPERESSPIWDEPAEQGFEGAEGLSSDHASSSI